MGCLRSLGRVNGYGKKQCRSLFWRVRAAVKKAVKSGGGKRHIKFQYDPSSYALNFDDGSCRLAGEEKADKLQKLQDNSNVTNTMWVYVLWVKS